MRFRSLCRFCLMSLGWAPPMVAAPAPPVPIVVGVGSSESLKVPQVIRVAVGNQKVAKVRAFPPDTVLITGAKVGKTTVRAWDGLGTERAFDVDVVAPEAEAARRSGEGNPVVRVAVEFFEVDSAAGEAAGIRWPDALQFSGAAHVQGDAATTGLNYASSFATAKGLIQHLLRNGWAKVLAKPELHVRLGEEAKFHSGGEFPVALSTPQYGNYHRRVEWKPYGISVKVRPQSGDGLYLQSDIQVEVSELDRSGGMEGVPSVTRRNLETKTDSRDGETVILSGLVRQAASVDKEGLPVLSDIPLLGNVVFGRRQEASESSELFLALTLSFDTRARVAQSLESRRRRLEASSPP